MWVSPMDFAVGLGASPTDVSPTDFLVRGFEALFPHAGTLGCAVCLTPQMFLPVYLHVNRDRPLHQLLPCQEFSPPWLPISAPPTSLDKCFFFNSLVVRLPYSSISVSSGCFLFLNILLSFFWLCEGATCIYLCLPVGQKS